jgi:hypothetical protein
MLKEGNVMEEKTKALQVRFPVDMYERLAKGAKKSRRSLNAEIVTCLEELFSWQDDWSKNQQKMDAMTPERMDAIIGIMKKLDRIEAYAKAHPEEFPL